MAQQSGNQPLMITSNQPLAEYPFPRALAELAQDRASGTLSVCRGKLERRILVKNGAPVYVESNVADDSLERFLVKRGELDQTVAFEAASEAVASNRPVGEVLVQKGAMGANEMFKRMKLCMGANLLATFCWVDGELRFDGRRPATEGKILLKAKAGPLVVRGVCAYSPFELINKEFLKFKCDRFKLAGTLQETIAQLQLDPPQSRIAHALTGAAAPNQIAVEADADMELVLRVLYSMVLLGAAKPAEVVERASSETDAPAASREPPGDEQPKAAEPAELATTTTPGQEAPTQEAPTQEAPTQEAPTQEAPPREPPPAEPAPLTQDERDKIERALSVAKSGTHYELLGVTPDARFGQLRRRFLRRCHELSPMSFAHRDVGGLGDQLEGLFLALVRAFSTLSVAGRRQAYDEKLKRGDRPAEAPRDDDQPRSNAIGRTTLKRNARRPSRATIREERKPPRQGSSAPESTNAFWVQEPPQASVAVKTAVAFLNLSQPADAVAGLVDAMKADPTDTLAVALLGYSLYLKDPMVNGTKATKYLRRAVTQDGAALLPKVLLGRVLELEQAPTEALACYQACLAMEPGHAEAAQAVRRLQRLV